MVKDYRSLERKEQDENLKLACLTDILINLEDAAMLVAVNGGFKEALILAKEKLEKLIGGL